MKRTIDCFYVPFFLPFVFFLFEGLNVALLCSSKHSILHQSTVECTMHPFEAICIPHAFQIFVWFEYEPPWIVDADPDRMTPWGDGFFNPICGCNLVHDTSCIDDFFVFFDWNEIWVCPINIFIYTYFGTFCKYLCVCCSNIVPSKKIIETR